MDGEFRQQAEKRIDAILGLRYHAFAYAAGMVLILVAWILVAIFSHNYFPWFLFPMFGWGIALFFHFRNVYGPRTQKRNARREAMIETEMQRLQRDLASKPESAWSAVPPALDEPPDRDRPPSQED